MAQIPPPSSFHLNESRMLTRSRRNHSNQTQTSATSSSSTGPGGGVADSQYAPGASHFLDDSEPDSPLSSVYVSSPLLDDSSSRYSLHSRQSSRGGRDSDASASGASSFGPERTSGSQSPIASTSSHHYPSNVNPVTGKRKRSRVTPVQLAHLERVFTKDKSPTAAKRKELAEILGMNERQTQVWFQNRRAKAKLLEQRARAGRPPVARGEHSGSSSGGSYATGGSGGPGGSEGDADALSRIHEDENVFLIPCSDLCIGTFRRVSAGLNDLIGYTCESKRFLAWYVYSAGTGFKMEVPFDNIISAELSEDATQHHSRATIRLSGPPIFLREFPAQGSLYDGYGGHKTWQRCDDWTENRQASSALLHQVVGRTNALEHALAQWLPQAPQDDEEAGRDLEEPPYATGPMRRKPSGASSRRSSGADASPIAAIQTPSLLSVIPSPVAPPSSYRDPFAAANRGIPSRNNSSSQLAPSAHARKRSRSEASSPFEPYGYPSSEFDLHNPQQHNPQPPHIHSIVTQSSTLMGGRSLGGPFSAGPFGPSDTPFASQQDQHSSGFDSNTFTDFESLLSYSAGNGGPSSAPASTHDDSFLLDAPVPIARNATASGRAPNFNGPGSRPGTAASMHSLSHSPFNPPAQPASSGMHPPSTLPSHQHQSSNQHQAFGMDSGIHSHHSLVHSGMDVSLGFDNGMPMGSMNDGFLVYPPQSSAHGEYTSQDTFVGQPDHSSNVEDSQAQHFLHASPGGDTIAAIPPNPDSGGAEA